MRTHAPPDAGSAETGREAPRWPFALAAAVVLVATGLVLGMALAGGVGRRRIAVLPPGGLSLSTLFGLGSLTWYAVLLSTPLLWWLTRRFPVERGSWRRALPVHLLVVGVLVLATAGVFYALLPITGDWDVRTVVGFFAFRLLTESVPFLALVAILHAIRASRRLARQRTEAARLESQLAEARLDALASKLQPHFFFNTLQAVSTLIHRDPKAADETLAHLSELLREVLRERSGHLVTLAEEVRLLQEYVAIWRARLPDRLAFEVDVPAGTERALVPFLLLQPVVENALEHGVGRRSGAGCVRVRAARAGDRLHLTVSDDGPGLGGLDAPPDDGLGLRNTRARLRAAFGEAQSLSWGEGEAGGLRVTISLPWRVHEVGGDA